MMIDELSNFDNVVQTYKRQHYKIQNLQKANIFLKTKLKEFEENKALTEGFHDRKGNQS